MFSYYISWVLHRAIFVSRGFFFFFWLHKKSRSGELTSNQFLLFWWVVLFFFFLILHSWFFRVVGWLRLAGASGGRPVQPPSPSSATRSRFGQGHCVQLLWINTWSVVYWPFLQAVLIWSSKYVSFVGSYSLATLLNLFGINGSLITLVVSSWSPCQMVLFLVSLFC